MAKITSSTITTQTSTKIYDVSIRPDVNNPTRIRIYVTGLFNGSTATLQSSPDGGTTKINEKDMFNASVVYTANGYFDLDIVSRTSKPGVDKPIQLYLTTTVANPTGIVATIFDMN